MGQDLNNTGSQGWLHSEINSSEMKYFNISQRGLYLLWSDSTFYIRRSLHFMYVITRIGSMK